MNFASYQEALNVVYPAPIQAAPVNAAAVGAQQAAGGQVEQPQPAAAVPDMMAGFRTQEQFNNVANYVALTPGQAIILLRVAAAINYPNAVRQGAASIVITVVSLCKSGNISTKAITKIQRDLERELVLNIELSAQEIAAVNQQVFTIITPEVARNVFTNWLANCEETPRHRWRTT